jgi:heme/copper-type cytochrome/quinol oxidase subunit 3
MAALFSSRADRQVRRRHAPREPRDRTLNTYVLVTSSFLAAMSVDAIRRQRLPASAALLFGTVLLGLGFHALKAAEYAGRVAEGIAPGAAIASHRSWWRALGSSSPAPMS